MLEIHTLRDAHARESEGFLGVLVRSGKEENRLVHRVVFGRNVHTQNDLFGLFRWPIPHTEERILFMRNHDADGNRSPNHEF